MKKWQVEKDQGMSLVELLVSVAILGIAMVGILALMNLSTRYYSNSSKEVEVQQELQTTFSMVSNMIVDANVSIEFKASENRAIIKTKEKRYEVHLSGRNLYAKEFLASAGTEDIDTAANLLADRVEAFSIDTSHYDDGYVTLAMTVKYGTRVASMTKNVFMRNAGKEKKDFLGQCETTVEADGSNSKKIYFTVEQDTGESISGSTEMVVKVKMGTAGSSVSVANASGADVSISVVGTPYYNPVTGVVTVHIKNSTGWDDGKSIKFSVTSSGDVDDDECRILTIGK